MQVGTAASKARRNTTNTQRRCVQRRTQHVDFGWQCPVGERLVTPGETGCEVDCTTPAFNQVAGYKYFSEILVYIAVAHFRSDQIVQRGLVGITLAHYVVGNAIPHSVVQTDR